MATKKVRVLRAVSIQGKDYRPDQVVALDVEIVKIHEADGSIDSSAAAVAYCEKEQKAAVADAEKAAE